MAGGVHYGMILVSANILMRGNTETGCVDNDLALNVLDLELGSLDVLLRRGTEAGGVDYSARQGNQSVQT